MILFILRGAFVLLATCIALLYVLQPYLSQAEKENAIPISFWQVVLTVGAAMSIALMVITVDATFKRKRLSALSGLLLGLMAGLLVTWAMSMIVDLIGLLALGDAVRNHPILQGVKVFIGVVMSYLGISLVLQTKDDFRFVIPYVEFAKQVRGTRPILLDTSIIIDGRILEIIDTQILQGGLVVPKFVLNELQTIADSSDRLKRARGRRGLEILQKLQDNTKIEVHIDESEVEGAGVDHKLIALAQFMPARVMTNDFNLNKIATLRGVQVINLNDLARALRPVALPGEAMTVRVVKPGENPNQGVGYLEDGTMVVVENAREAIGNEVELIVTSTLQTSAGRMIFGKLTSEADSWVQSAIAEKKRVADETDGNGSRSSAHRSSRNPRRGE